MAEKTRRTQLYEFHKDKAKLTVFAGFEMPLCYEDITPEHLAVRTSVGIFDIGHMGRVLVTGSDSERFLNYVITNDVSRLLPNSAQYTVMCNEDGGVLDDFVMYCLEAEKYLVVPNASNRKKDYNWLVENSAGFKVAIQDVSDDVAMFAVQGPKAEKALQSVSAENLSMIGRFKCANVQLSGVDVFLSRTGYTGEDGFEIFVWDASLAKPEKAVRLWKSILEAGKIFGIKPCGLGARDTLRLEAGMCLYGNDLNESTTPLEAALGFVVKFQKESFIGKETLEKQKIEGIERKRVGVRLMEPGIPRPGHELYTETGEKVGKLTSGTFSPLLKTGIGMGYVQTSAAQEGTSVRVKVRNRLLKGTIAGFPLYDAEKYGLKRKTAQE